MLALLAAHGAGHDTPPLYRPFKRLGVTTSLPRAGRSRFYGTARGCSEKNSLLTTFVAFSEKKPVMTRFGRLTPVPSVRL